MHNFNKSLRRSLSFSLVTIIFHANAASLDSSSKVEQGIIVHAQTSQNTISASSDRAFELQGDIEVLTLEIENLKVYKQHLTTLIDSQNQELASLAKQQNEIIETRQSIVPLMYQMLDDLDRYIEQDMPIRKQARQQRVAALRILMTDANISDSEKYRRILEAYQIELDYVNKLDVYVSLVDIAGAFREVEQLYLGHLSLVARSLDKQHYWYWSNDDKAWIMVESSLHSPLENAYRVAHKEVTPSLLRLPLSVTPSMSAEVTQ
jgi:hypothetical protein